MNQNLITPPVPRLLNAAAAAAFLGISERTFDTYWREEKLPAPHRIGRRVLWDWKLLDKYVDELSGLATPAPPLDDRW